MQFPRYELVIPLYAQRTPPDRRPRGRPVRPPRRRRVGSGFLRTRPALGAARGGRPQPTPRLDAQQYLALEFRVDERR